MMNQSILFFELLNFYSALAILEPQIYVVVEKFEAESISLFSGRLAWETDANFRSYQLSRPARTLIHQHERHSGG